MEKIENFTQEKYDKLKIFLISNFNIRFLQSENPDVIESFEINTTAGTITGNFFTNELLELNHSGDTLKSYNIILAEINNSTNTTSDLESMSSADELLNDSKSILEHIFTCDICKLKLLDILKHAKTKS